MAQITKPMMLDETGQAILTSLNGIKAAVEDGSLAVRGADGAPGAAGANAGFGTPTASVDANVGTPSVTVTASGPDTAKVFNFQFKNMKGANGAAAGFGAPTAVATVGGGDPAVVITPSGPDTAKVFGFAFNNVKGPLADNAGAHNGIFRGKNLGTTVTAAQYAAISAGTFEDLYIGDYWVIDGVNWRIAAFDYWLNCGDQGSGVTQHHVVIVPDTCLYNCQYHNTENGQYSNASGANTTEGGYVGSDLYKGKLYDGTTPNGFANSKTKIINVFGQAHILSHREYFSNQVTDGMISAGAWYDSEIDLMNEFMVYGARHFGNALTGTYHPLHTTAKSQLPLFTLAPHLITNRALWWLRDVAAATGFAIVHVYGNSYYNAASVPHGVRPAFAIH